MSLRILVTRMMERRRWMRPLALPRERVGRPAPEPLPSGLCVSLARMRSSIQAFKHQTSFV